MVNVCLIFFMLLNLLKVNKSNQILEINQSNVFYNYVIGFETESIDLVNTAGKLLKTGISKSVFFSDFKCIYLDDFGKIKVELIEPESRQWDSNWDLKFNSEIPNFVIADLRSSLEIAFHENQILNQGELYLRASLPPLVLEDEYSQIALFATVKIYANGIAILSFQFDAEWNRINENDFILDVVNFFQRYFKKIWVDSKMQKIDADIALKNAFEDKFSFAGTYLKGRKIKQLIKEMKRDSQEILDNTFKTEGTHFNLGNEEWLLHQIAGTENNDSWESTLEYCRSIYSNVVSSMIVSHGKLKNNEFHNFIWEGRPSVSLLRFENQPKSKKELFQNFSKSLIKILLRANIVEKISDLPPDLRMFEDYCLHANRSIILFTWLRPNGASDNIWNDPNTLTKLFENQARVEQIEYYNMSIARACSWAHKPSTENHLLNAYQILVNSEKLIHQSSKIGEVIDAISYLIKAFGTLNLISSAKEAARFYLDELKYKLDVIQNRNSRRLTFLFGLVGATSFAEFITYPLVLKLWPMLSKTTAPILSFSITAVLLFIFIKIILSINRK